jgi:hypothetical protein
MKGHDVPLAAFGANALNLHFVVVFNFILFPVFGFVCGNWTAAAGVPIRLL